MKYHVDPSDVAATPVSVAQLRCAGVGDVRSAISNGSSENISTEHSLYSPVASVFIKGKLHYDISIRNVKRIVKSTQVERFSLDGVLSLTTGFV